MKKRIQNITAESRRTLPVAMLYGTAIWVLAGLFREQWCKNDVLVRVYNGDKFIGIGMVYDHDLHPKRTI